MEPPIPQTREVTVRLGKLLKKLGIMAIMLILMGGCELTSQKPAVDRSILTDDPCAAPCWQGIVPGQTTIDEALNILDTLGVDYMRFDNEVQWHSESYYRGDGFAFAGNVLYGPEYGDSTSVTLLRIGLEFELTLQEVLDKYGPPKKFQAYGVDLPVLPDGHVNGIVVSFFYPERGVVFQAWLHGTRPASIESDTTLKAVHYFAPTTMEQLFVQVPRMKTYLRGDTWKDLQDWQGLGRIPEVH